MVSNFTKEDTVAHVLEELSDAETIFEEYGVNPLRDCGTNIYTIQLKDTPEKCFVEDLDGLLNDLNQALQSERTD